MTWTAGIAFIGVQTTTGIGQLHIKNTSYRVRVISRTPDYKVKSSPCAPFIFINLRFRVFVEELC